MSPAPEQRLRPSAEPAAGVRMAFSGRGDGNLALTVGPGDVAAHRAALLARVGLTVDDGVFMRQVHGARTVVVGRGQRGRGARRPDDAVADADALVTADPGVALVVLVADCVPVLLADPRGAVGAVHAGRRGVLAGVVGNAVRALRGALPGGDRGGDAGVEAVIGPAVGGCCYEVPQAMAERFWRLLPAARARTSWGTSALDLPAAVAAQLRAAGVRRVRRAGGCTHCRPERWFSHRRSPTGPAAGRQAGVIARLDPPPAAAQPPRSGAPASLD